MSERLMARPALESMAPARAWWGQAAILVLLIGALYFDIIRRYERVPHHRAKTLPLWQTETRVPSLVSRANTALVKW